jgi:peptidoglycan/LPS O-acetylase OafA/YrhL
MASGGGISSRVGHIPSLDGLRAVAILIVLWGHSEFSTVVDAAAGTLVLKGSVGVTVFFFLSGYLITTLLRVEADVRGRISVRDFYIRRAIRILPPLYIVLGLAVAATAGGLFAAEMSRRGVLAAATFWANYFIIVDGRDGLPGGMNALWSLAVEEHYYLLFPLLYIALRRWLPSRRHQALVLVALCLGIAAWRTYLDLNGASWDRLYLATDTRADAILWGSVMAIICNPVLGDVRAPRRAWQLTPVLLTSVAVFYAVSRTPDAFGMTVGYTIQSIALFGVFLPLILAPGSVLGRVVNWRPVAFVGVLSYSLYLVHRPVLRLVEERLDLPAAMETVIGLAISFALAYVMHRLVERPAATLRRRVSRSKDSRSEGDRGRGPGGDDVPPPVSARGGATA